MPVLAHDARAGQQKCLPSSLPPWGEEPTPSLRARCTLSLFFRVGPADIRDPAAALKGLTLTFRGCKQAPQDLCLKSPCFRFGFAFSTYPKLLALLVNLQRLYPSLFFRVGKRQTWGYIQSLDDKR